MNEPFYLVPRQPPSQAMKLEGPDSVTPLLNWLATLGVPAIRNEYADVPEEDPDLRSPVAIGTLSVDVQWGEYVVVPVSGLVYTMPSLVLEALYEKSTF